MVFRRCRNMQKECRRRSKEGGELLVSVMVGERSEGCGELRWALGGSGRGGGACLAAGEPVEPRKRIETALKISRVGYWQTGRQLQRR